MISLLHVCLGFFGFVGHALKLWRTQFHKFACRAFCSVGNRRAVGKLECFLYGMALVFKGEPNPALRPLPQQEGPGRAIAFALRIPNIWHMPRYRPRWPVFEKHGRCSGHGDSRASCFSSISLAASATKITFEAGVACGTWDWAVGASAKATNFDGR